MTFFFPVWISHTSFSFTEFCGVWFNNNINVIDEGGITYIRKFAIIGRFLLSIYLIIKHIPKI